MEYNSIPISAEEALKYVQNCQLMGGWHLCSLLSPDRRVEHIGVVFPYPVYEDTLKGQLKKHIGRMVKEEPTELTVRQYLEQTRDLWWWMANNPGKSKGDWPGWEEIWKTRSVLSDCPLCDYALKQYEEHRHQAEWSSEEMDARRSYSRRCSYCPLKDKWGGEPRSDGIYLCLDVGSPFERWCNARLSIYADLSKQRIAAARLALLCEEVIEELEAK